MKYVLWKESVDKYISYSNTNKVIHVDTLEEAHKFNSPNQARAARWKASKKMAYFCVYAITEDGKIVKVSANTIKRKSFSGEERIQIYRKTKGHCYLCGEFVDFEKFEIEHRLPVSKGGTNDFSNVFCSCHICNTIKHDIYPEDFMERISKIFLYQMEKKSGNSIKWKIIHRLLNGMV